MVHRSNQLKVMVFFDDGIAMAAHIRAAQWTDVPSRLPEGHGAPALYFRGKMVRIHVPANRHILALLHLHAVNPDAQP